MLNQYLSITNSLIQTPASPIPLITTALLTTYINIARAQVAVDGECVRTTGSATIAAGLATQPLASVTLPATGFMQPLVSRNAFLSGVRVDIRPWDWFVAYNMNSPKITPVMSHQGQGTFADIYVSSQAGGSLWLDVVALPINLAADTDPEVIPYPWTDAVPFYAAYYAYMAFQRQADAEQFMARYRELMRRARGESTSTNLPDNDPGGLGAMIAASKMALGQLPPQPAPQRGRPAG
jgi:hypothetical protein